MVGRKINRGTRLNASGWDLNDVSAIQKIGKSHSPVARVATTYWRMIRARLPPARGLVVDRGTADVAARKASTGIGSATGSFVRFMPSPLPRSHVYCRSLERRVEPDDRDIDDEQNNESDRAGRSHLIAAERLNPGING